MTEGTENLDLEILKRLQGEFSLMREDMRGMRTEMGALKQHMAAFMTAEVNRDAGMANFNLRLERIERRLDLID